jgi:hypothetical protein
VNKEAPFRSSRLMTERAAQWSKNQTMKTGQLRKKTGAAAGLRFL